MTGDGGLVEVQATAERTPLSRAHLDELLALAQQGIEGLRAAQAAADRVGGTRAAGPRHPQRAQGARARAPAARRRARAAAGRRRRCRPRTATRSPRTRSARRARPPRRSGRPAIADDSGIEAAALGGAPGRPLGALRRPGRDRRARTSPAARPGARAARRLRYVCVMAYAEPGGEERAFDGPCDGHARRRRRAATAASATTRRSCPTSRGDGRTMAELDRAEKDAISHRGRAARALLAWLLAERAHDGRATSPSAAARRAARRPSTRRRARAPALRAVQRRRGRLPRRPQARHRPRHRIARLPRRGRALGAPTSSPRC